MFRSALPRMWCVVASLLLTTATQASTCAKEAEPCEQAWPLRAIRSIHIAQIWSKVSSEETTIDCGRIPLNKTMVLAYLRRAGRISEHDALHQVDYSPCRAAGSLQTRDGRRADWSIGILREGRLVWTDNQETVHLYCSRCRTAPFRH